MGIWCVGRKAMGSALLVFRLLATYEEIDRFLRPLALADVEQMTLSPRVYKSERWQLFLIADV